MNFTRFTSYTFAFIIWTFFRQVHLELCRISKTLCNSFGMQIASEMGISIMLITGCLYNLYIYLMHQKTDFNNSLLDATSVVLTMGVIEVVKIIFINRVCKNATDEVSRPASCFLLTYLCIMLTYLCFTYLCFMLTYLCDLWNRRHLLFVQGKKTTEVIHAIYKFCEDVDIQEEVYSRY